MIEVCAGEAIDLSGTTRHRVLASLGWNRQTDPTTSTPLKHPVNGEVCHWYDGEIDGIQWSAWIGTKTGAVYPHGAADCSFDEFCKTVANGWAKVTPARSLFGDE